MNALRPAGSGTQGQALAYLRETMSPAAAMIVAPASSHVELSLPPDWPSAGSGSVAERNLGHALGWTLEVRIDDIVLLNPLGEGLVQLPVPELSVAWLHQARTALSVGVYLLNQPQALDDGRSPAAIVNSLPATSMAAATVRTAIDDRYGSPPSVGRNDPCWCGSQQKFKRCHGR